MTTDREKIITFFRERNKNIWIWRQEGMTYREIGEQIDLSTERVRQICVREQRRAEQH